MQRFWSFRILLALLFAAPLCGAAQESSEAVAARQAMQENMRVLNGRMEELEGSYHTLRARVDDMRREMQQLREEMRKLGDQSALQEQIKRLAESVKDVDNRRRQDNEKVLSELAKIAKQVAEAPLPAPPPRPVSNPTPRPAVHDTEKPDKDSSGPAIPTKGIEHLIKSGDTLSGIVTACRAQGLKVTYKMLKDANPDVNWDKLKVGQKIFIPVPNQ